MIRDEKLRKFLMELAKISQKYGYHLVAPGGIWVEKHGDKPGVYKFIVLDDLGGNTEDVVIDCLVWVKS